MNPTPDDDLGPEKLLHYGVEGIVDNYDNEVADHDRSTLCSFTEEILTDNVLSELQREVLFQSYPENYGIGNLIKAKTIIKVHYTE